MSDFFHFDDTKFSASPRKLRTPKLQENEARYSRSKVASGFGLFCGVVATTLTDVAAFLIPLYCIRANELASRKCDAIQTELARRGIPPTKTNFRDVRHGFGAALLGHLVLPLAKGLAEDGAYSSAAGDIRGGSMLMWRKLYRRWTRRPQERPSPVHTSKGIKSNSDEPDMV